MTLSFLVFLLSCLFQAVLFRIRGARQQAMEDDQEQANHPHVVDDSLQLLSRNLAVSPASQMMAVDVGAHEAILAVATQPWSFTLRDTDYKLLQVPSETFVIEEIPGIRAELKSALGRPYNKAKKKEVADVQELQKLLLKQFNVMAVVAARLDRLKELIPNDGQHDQMGLIADHAVRDMKKLILRTSSIMTKSSDIVRETARSASGLKKQEKPFDSYATTEGDLEELRALKEDKKTSAIIQLAASSRRIQSAPRFGGAPINSQFAPQFRGRAAPPASRGGRGNAQRGRG